MIVGWNKVYTGTTLSDYALPYCCLYCRYNVTARVFAFGSGTASSPYSLDNDGAASSAERRAAKMAERTATRLVRSAACPACHRRDRGPIRRVQALLALECTAIAIVA